MVLFLVSHDSPSCLLLPSILSFLFFTTADSENRKLRLLLTFAKAMLDVNLNLKRWLLIPELLLCSQGGTVPGDSRQLSASLHLKMKLIHRLFSAFQSQFSCWNLSCAEVS